jgi:hypothetical protein
MSTSAEMRDAIVNLVEALIDVLDIMDADPDFEPDVEIEEELDEDTNPISLNREIAA